MLMATSPTSKITTSPTPHPTKFHLFSLLPKELQLHMSLLLPGPRDLTINFKKSIDIARKRFAEVCHESRELALQTYKPYFETEHSNRVTYLNLALDTVRLPDGVISYLKERELMAIRNLVLEVRDCAYFAHFHMETLKRMRGLKRLDILTIKEIYGWDTRENVERVVRDFEDAKELDRGECPGVRVSDLNMDEGFGMVEAGALIPGWVAPVDGEAGNYEPDGTTTDFV
ncbi:hypothetical protein BJ875DRAFT_481752 [Amylocarpus encephaloides]|uniref:2EXR domain-containing protein n=1 Tax=Amylocarpus encephaloides TaxID=45428 RepID=A0A9P8C864_9HELO|nr:hypothetical protein BJ875DRAFT_481752 [Amylocarpus encephaloides]